MTKILLNGSEVDADPTKPLIHACHTEGVDVPMYCYHPGLSPVGSCRICQVEVKQGEMPPRVVVACRTPVVEGMVVDTRAPKAHEARRQCLEFLLKNHPLDCPICDKAGECDLQDFAFDEQQGKGRSVEPRRKLDKRKSLGDVIVLDEERCILCSRCVRFFEEVTEKPQLTVADLGSRSVISTFMDRPLEGNYQGNIADICPVGALTLKKFRFQARVWNLRSAPSTCGECSRGCSTLVDVLRGGAVKRVRPRYDEHKNRWWMCDVGRFVFDRWDVGGRLAGAAVRGGAGFEHTDVEEALDAAADVLRVHPPSLVLVSPFVTVEEGERTLAFAQSVGARAAFLAPPPNDLGDDFLHTGDPCPNRRGLALLGFDELDLDAAAEALGAAEAALLVGERSCELLGERMDALRTRLVVLDERLPQAASVRVAFGIPISIEKNGRWVNVDGYDGRLSIARPAPAGAWPIERLLDGLEARLATAEAGA